MEYLKSNGCQSSLPFTGFIITDHHQTEDSKNHQKTQDSTGKASHLVRVINLPTRSASRRNHRPTER